MKIQNSVQRLRKTRGFPAARLAAQVGVTRQTIYAIEDGGFVPNTAVALRLARVLDTTVEELFSFADEGAVERQEVELVDAVYEEKLPSPFVKLCSINDRLLAVSVPAKPMYLPAADGVISSQHGSKLLVETVLESQTAQQRLLLAGCDPALSLLAKTMSGAGVDLVSLPCSSRRALDLLKAGRVHVAGSHLRDAASGQFNIPVVASEFKASQAHVVTFAVWQQGLLVAAGNPKGIRGVADLARKEISVVNRERGSGSRDLLDRGLKAARIQHVNVKGYKRVAEGHLPAASDVAAGLADCCVAPESAARLYGLHFIPLETERFDLVFPPTTIDLPGGRAMMDTLQRASFRRALRGLAGYDTTHTGQLLS